MSKLQERIQAALDECRMLILGGQVLISVGAEAVLQPRFDDLSFAGRWACAGGTLSLTAAVGLFMWPAAYHRIVLRGQDSQRLHDFATAVLAAGLAPFALGLGAGLYVVGERVGGPVLGIVLGGSTCLLAGGAWYLYPLARRRPSAGQKEPPMSDEPTPISDKIRHALTEARMVLPGAQALLGFGTISVLMDAFDRLPGALKAVQVTGLGFVAIAIILLMTPAAYHRIAEDGRSSDRFYRIATACLLAAMASLAMGLASAAWMVVERASQSRFAGIAAALAVVSASYSAWFGWTWSQARRA